MQSKSSITTHCLSFDVEEHFQVSAFDSLTRRRYWDQFESRVEQNTERVLALLADAGVRATFFVLGWVAERHPGLVCRIALAGHEVACHGYAHKLVTTQDAIAFREDIRRAKKVLEDILGKPVYGYRAPSFTITKHTMWALPLLVEEGYRYDSSIFPIWHDRYGMPSANPLCHQVLTEAGPIWEVPPSTVKLARLRMPIAGGGYFRLIPYPVLRRLLKKVEGKGIPLVMYFHPWELDPEQPRMEGPLFSRFRHYMNLAKTASRLRCLLKDFRFAPIQELVSEWLRNDSDQPSAWEVARNPKLPDQKLVSAMQSARGEVLR